MPTFAQSGVILSSKLTLAYELRQGKQIIPAHQRMYGPASRVFVHEQKKDVTVAGSDDPPILLSLTKVEMRIA